VVKNITEYGAFVDLGGVDGLLHVTDMAWRRVNHPSEILAIGETVKVQVIKINKETHRISLGMKQLQSDPWDSVEKALSAGFGPQGPRHQHHRLRRIRRAGAGVEGLVHVSEMSWTKKNVHPGKIVSTSQEVDVMVLEIDSAKRRVSLGLKQTMRNPWEVFAETHPVGTAIEGEVKNITEFGLFVAWTATSTAWSTCPTCRGTSAAKTRSRTTARATRSRPPSPKWTSSGTYLAVGQGAGR
jgi:small subunit ribosomal protein S1